MNPRLALEDLMNQPAALATVTGAATARQHAQTRGWTFVDLDELTIPTEVIATIPARQARELRAVPVAVAEGQVTVAVSNPDDMALRQSLRPLFAGRTLRMAYADPRSLSAKLEAHYSARSEAARLGAAGEASASAAAVASQGGDIGRIETVSETSTAHLFGLWVEQALRDGASDIHVEPTETGLEVRYRVDGLLTSIGQYPLTRQAQIATYIKVEAGMKSDNTLLPDSGVIAYRPAGRQPVDIRVETAPTAWGQSVVMRLQAEIWRPLSELGLSATNERRFRAALAQPHGIILATGATGSGKSTTLYSAIREKIDSTRKIITIEDPVEFKVPAGVSQMSVNEATGLTFEKGLRSMLRQDPNVILLGEIRDTESAETAVNAAMTGHLVLSTLHTNSAADAITRLSRLGIDPFLVASGLLAVVGQALVRRLCEHCRFEYEASAEELAAAGLPVEFAGVTLHDPTPGGCDHCLHGYRGRIPLHEVLLMTDEICDLINDNAPLSKIRDAAHRSGMTTMREDGYEKVRAGVISVHDLNDSTRRNMLEML